MPSATSTPPPPTPKPSDTPTATAPPTSTATQPPTATVTAIPVRVIPGISEVQYRSGDPSLSAYLCIPEGRAPFPAVIYNHGGLGDQMGGAPEETCAALARDGYVGLSPLRRQTVSLEGHLDDVLAAVDFLLDLEYVDKDRVGIMGFSRGGMLTFAAATVRSEFGAIIIMAPAPPKGPLENSLSAAANVSAPVLFLVAENDTMQADHIETSRTYMQALVAAGKDAALILYPPYKNDGHWMFFEIGDYWSDVQRYFDEHLN